MIITKNYWLINISEINKIDVIPNIYAKKLKPYKCKLYIVICNKFCKLMR